MLPCLNKKIFGVECMGCGLQRSLLLLLKGEFREAFFMYPAIYPLLILCGFIGYTMMKPFEKDWIIKVSLSVITILTIIVNYCIKMELFFN